MAGIGFELERFLKRDSFVTDAVGQVAVGAAYAGPWIFGTLSMALLYLQFSTSLAALEQALLFAMITYSFAGATLLTSAFTLPLLRDLADRIYAGELDRVAPSFAGAWILHLVAAALLGVAFYGAAPLPFEIKLIGILLIVSCTQLWLAGALVSLLRSHRFVLATFVLGYGAGAWIGLALGPRYGVPGYLGGVWAGTSLIALTLTARLQLALTWPAAFDFHFVRTAARRPAFALVGVTLAAGCWVDKAIFWWFSEHAHVAAPLLRFVPVYDATYFVAALATVPALAWALLRVETGFATSSRRLFAALSNKLAYADIRDEKAALAATMNADFWGVLRLQAPVTLLLFCFAPQLVAALNLPAHVVHVLRLHLLAATGMVLVQVQTLYLLYFDRPRDAAWGTAVFCIANAGLTALSLRTGYWSYGLGNLAAVWLSAAVSAGLIRRALRDLEYGVLRHFARASLVGAPR